MNNIDEDIKILEEFTESSCCLYGQEEIIEATKNVLSELKKKNKRIENLQEENELQHCDLQNSYSVNNGLKKELETYKKIAEKLADYIMDIYESRINLEIITGLGGELTFKDVIDWARKEVEKDENKRN